MAKQLEGTIRFARIQSNREDDYIQIEIDDEKSGIAFISVKMSMEQFGKVVAGVSNNKVKMEVRGLDNIGKRHERKPGRFIIPKVAYDRIDAANRSRGTLQEALGEWLQENAKEDGWKISTYLGSRNSIEPAGDSWLDGDKALNFHYYRYVDDNEG